MPAGPGGERPIPLTLRLFGPFVAEVDGIPLLPFRTRKGQWLLALLTLRHGAEVDRDWLAGVLWPESSQSMALANVRGRLADLRRVLGSQGFRLRSPALPQPLRGPHQRRGGPARFDAAIRRGDEPTATP
jgi:hypothetical protein